MEQAPRKYFSEISLVLATARCAVIAPDELMSGKLMSEKTRDVIDACHIYAICRRPRLTFDRQSFKINGTKISGKVVRKISGVSELYDFSSNCKNIDGGPISLSAYPHDKILGHDKFGVVTSHWPASIIPIIGKTHEKLRDFEVLYVGQAFGDGTRTAFTRLQKHETLQKILADEYKKGSDTEVLIFLFEYPDPQISISMDGITKDAEIQDEYDTIHIMDVFSNPPSKKQIISIAEAGLIWYFQPVYNKLLKNSKPNSELKLLESCYNFDIAGLVVELNTEGLKCRLWSPVRSFGYHHIAMYDLHDPKKRRSFFQIPGDSTNANLKEQSGPVIISKLNH